MATGRLGAAPVLKTRWTKEPSAGTTSLSGLDANSVSLVYSVGYEQVYRNGVLLSRGNDYTATDGTTITLTDATVAGDIVEVFANELIPLSDAIGKGQYNAKGALVSASAASTPATLAVGANGETLVADSSATTGLRWQGDWNTGKNKIINGDYYWNQRAFSSSTAGASNAYGFDRWMQVSAGGTTTWTAQTFTPGAAPVAGYEGKNFLQIASTGQSGANDNSRILQKIEDVRTFANQTITVSFWAKASSGTPSVAISLYQDFGTGGSPSAGAIVNGDKVAITTSWARYSFTVSIPTISGKTLGTNNDHSLWVNIWTSAGTTFNAATNSLGIQTTTIQLWGVQAEAGSVATPFTTAAGSIGGELALCQRYYQRWTTTDNTALFFGTKGNASSTTNVDIDLPLTTQMRIKPTSLETNNIGVYRWSNATAYTTGTWAIIGASTALGNTVSVRYTHGTAVFTINDYVPPISNNSGGSHIAVSSEL